MIEGIKDFRKVIEFNEKISNLIVEEKIDPATVIISLAMTFENYAMAFLLASDYDKEMRDHLIQVTDQIGDKINIEYLKHAKNNGKN